MTKHKVFLTMLVVVITLLGVTAGIAYAESPPQENLDPEQMLSGDALQNWHALADENQAVFLNEIIPQIPERVSDPSLRPGVLAGLVTVMHKIQVKREERAQQGGVTLNSNTVTCDFDIDVNSSGAATMLDCEAEMAHIKVRARLARVGGWPSVGDNTETCWSCSYEWATVPYSIPSNSGKWIGFGWAYPTGHTGGPYPQYSRYHGDDLYDSG